MCHSNKRPAFWRIPLFVLAIALGCDARPAAARYALEWVQADTAPVIDKSNPGSAGNGHGYEGGAAFGCLSRRN
jgi:hypothetical protein